MEWSTEIPLEEGWYYERQADGYIRVIEVFWAGIGKSRHLLYVGEGTCIYKLEESLFARLPDPPPYKEDLNE